MNLDLLKKLTRLANNNPNDNEANLAARRVCKILEEGNWSLPSIQSRPNTVPPRTWNDAWRSTEPQWKSKPPDKPSEPDREHQKRQEEFYRKYYRPSRAQEEFFRDIYVGVDFGFGPSKPSKPPREKRPMECTRCHQTKETAYVGNLYICNECIWNEYKEKRA
jgi:hypothetical protein